MTSVRHTNGDYLRNATPPNAGSTFYFYGWAKIDTWGNDYTTSFSFDDGASEFLLYQTSGPEFGNTSGMVQIYRNGSTDEVEVLSGSDTSWIFICVRHVGGTNVYRVSYRRVQDATLTHVDLNAGAEADSMDTLHVGTDGANEHAINAASRHFVVGTTTLTDGEVQTLSETLAAPGGSPHTYLDLDSPTNAGTNAGSGGNYTVTGTLTTESTEPALSSPITLSPGAQALSISQQDPVVSQGAGGLTLQPGAQALTVAQQAPDMVWDFGLSPGAQALTVAQQAPAASEASEDHWVVSFNGRYFENDYGVPQYEHGDTAWSLLVQLNLTDTITYLDWCVSAGVNSINCNLMEAAFTDHSPPERNANGDLPFTNGNFNFTTGDANEAYFDHVRAVFAAARARHIQIKLWHTYLGFGGGSEGWWSDISGASTSDQTAWGVYVGNLCLPYPNILYVDGGDYDPGSYTVVNRVHDGITSVDTWHEFFGYHAGRGENGWEVGAAGQTFWLCYPADPLGSGTYPDVLAGYGQGTTRPVTFDEGYYEDSGHTDIAALRGQNWHAAASGAAGERMGDGDRWSFNTSVGQNQTGDTWQQSLSHDYTTQMFHLQSFLRIRRWWLLEPDETDTFVTAGRGSAGPDYRTAAYDAAGGTWGFVYVPDGSSGGSVTIDRTEMSATFVAHWYNPRDGSYTISGTTHANTGTENFTAPDGNDWLLVLDVAFPTILAVASAQALTIAQPAPTVSHGSPIALQPAAQALAVAQAAPSIAFGGIAVGPGAQAATLGQPAPTLAAGVIELQPGAQGLAFAQPAPSAAVGAIAVAPSAQDLATAQPAPSLAFGGIGVSTGAQALSLAQLAPLVTTGELILQPPAQGLGLGQSAPTLAFGGIAASPGAQALSFTPQAPTASLGGTTAAPGAQALSFGQLAPTALPGGIAVLPSAQALAIGAVDPLVLNGGVALQPAALALALGQLAPSLSFGGVALSPGVIAAMLAQPAPAAAPGGVTLSPALQTVAVALLAHAVELGQATLAPPALAVALALQAPAVQMQLQILEPAAQAVVLTQVAHVVQLAGMFAGVITDVGTFTPGGGFIHDVGYWEDP